MHRRYLLYLETLHRIRIAVMGKTGAGKSALGNTLLGESVFESIPAGQSVTTKCEAAERTILKGRKIKVVDTPGILDSYTKEVVDEVMRSVEALSPGPHAFLIVLDPNRARKEEMRILQEMIYLFGEKDFLDHSLIVMVRKHELVDENGVYIDIHEYIDKYSSADVKKLYGLCHKRAVAVENICEEPEKEVYRKAILDEIDKMAGKFYDNRIFHLIQENEKRKQEMQTLKERLDKKFCVIL